jgi:hypothetical protein
MTNVVISARRRFTPRKGWRTAESGVWFPLETGGRIGPFQSRGDINMRILLAAIAATAFAGTAAATSLGAFLENHLAANSVVLFGINAPLAASAPTSPTTGYRKPTDTVANLVALAPGLTASIVTRTAANSLDMLLPYPPSAPTHIIACIESARASIGLNPDGSTKYNPSVQRIEIATGAVTTILRGMDRCDGIRRTPWNTVIVNEEVATGRVYEIIQPLATTEATVTDRATGAVTSANVAQRTALPMIAWEGFDVTRDGVVFGADELRPGTGTADADGGSLYKFIPATPWNGSAVTTLAQSPLVAGTAYAVKVSCNPTTIQTGQGCEVGNASWIQVNPATARAEANSKRATGYYRPEDMHLDKGYTTPGAKVCVSITGNPDAKNYAEVLCLTDRSPLTAPVPSQTGTITHTAEVQRILIGNTTFNSFDNLDFQANRHNLHVAEDAPNGDIWACLRDGSDKDGTLDGCIRWLSVKDTSAEPTGVVFDATGRVAYVSLSHSEDSAMPLVDGFRTDDLLVITGFQ